MSKEMHRNDSFPPLTILILCQQQFGYHIDTFFYCKYLGAKHNLTYLCWDYGYNKQEMKEVSIHYVSRKGNIAKRNLRYILEVKRFLRKNKVDICFIKYFRGCSLLRLLCPKTQFIFDIRTGYVGEKSCSRWLYDGFMRFESLFFKHVTIISNSLAKKMKLCGKSKILPLGSVPIDESDKSFEKIHLLYVGTLQNRKIERTISGFSQFLSSTPLSLQISYTIIGSGPNREEEKLKEKVKQMHLEDKINIVGRVPFSELEPYFAKANVGVSFVPITPYYDPQPVTKTFDYLLSGMAVLATGTSENKLVINKNNGIIIADTATGFCQGLCRLIRRTHCYSSRLIRSKSQQYHWCNIVHDLEDLLFTIHTE